MTIEVMTLITGISVSLGIISTILNLRRTNRVDTKNTIIETANLNNKIDNVLIGISELKVKLNTMETDQKDSKERIIILEQKVKTLSETVNKTQEHIDMKWGNVKLLVDNFQIKASYKDGIFYDKKNEKIDESKIQKIILDFNDFKEIFQPKEEEKNKKKKIKDEQ